jgi:pilus assembly protein CpaF
MREALSVAAEALSRAVAREELSPDAINPFRHTEAQRRDVRHLLSRMRAEGRLPSHIAESDLPEITRWLVGMGPLDPLLEDPSIVSVQVTAHDRCAVYRNGVWQRAAAAWESPAHFRQFAEVLAARTGTALGPDTPVVQADFHHPAGRLQIDGTARTPAGVTMHMRLGRRVEITLEQMVSRGGMSGEMYDFLREIARRDAGVLIVGLPGSGKTTLLEALIALWPPSQPTIALDDRSEFTPRHESCVLYNLPPEKLRAGFVHALRKNVTKLAVAEVRGEEAAEMLQYSGAMVVWTTLHGSTANAVTRLMSLAQGAPGSPYQELPEALVRRIITAAFPIVIQTDVMIVGGHATFYIAEIAASGETLTPLFRAVVDGPAIRGYEQVGDPDEVLSRYRRRVWGTVDLPPLPAVAKVAEFSPAAALTALESYLRVHAQDAQALALLRTLRRSHPEINRELKGRVGAYHRRVQAALEARRWAELLGLYAEIEADPLVRGVALEVSGLDAQIMPVRREELARRAAAVASVQETLAVASDVMAAVAVWHAVQEEPEIYPEGLLEEARAAVLAAGARAGGGA